MPSALHKAWTRLHHRGRLVRFAVKGAFVALAVLAVCYPHPRLLARHLAHLRHLHELIEPDAPQLAPLSAALNELLDADAAPHDVLPTVQQLVEKRIAYAFDWETWGVIDYLPTVAEVVALGREDCDGKAVLAASLLRRRGIPADIVTDGAHVWVWTPYGPTMSPDAVATVHVTDTGRRFNWRGLQVLPRGAAYGMAVFPLGRELIVLLALWAALLHPQLGARRGLGCLILLLAALGLIRFGGENFRDPSWWLLGAGALAFIGACVVTAQPAQSPTVDTGS